MDNNRKRSRFGFNIQPDLREYQKKEPEPVASDEGTENSPPGQEGEKVTDLLKDASVGMMYSAVDLILYILIWYVAYPLLMFTSFYMSQKYLHMDFDTLGIMQVGNAFITVCAGAYYAYYLLSIFINEHSDSEEYAKEKQYFLQRLASYAILMAFVLYTSNLLQIGTLKNVEIQKLFVIFYLIYIAAISVFRHFNNRISKPG